MRRRLIALALPMLAALAAPDRAPALDDMDPARGSAGAHELVALEDDFARAVVKRDAANLERLLAKGFVYTENDETMTREALVAALTTGAERVESAANEGMTIHDFGSGDLINLSQIDAVAGGGNDAFTFIGSNAFGNHAGELRAVFAGGDWMVQGDFNGDGIADIEFVVSSDHPIVGTDFIL